jgi:hypothetical protein
MMDADLVVVYGVDTKVLNQNKNQLAINIQQK